MRDSLSSNTENDLSTCNPISYRIYFFFFKYPRFLTAFKLQISSNHFKIKNTIAIVSTKLAHSFILIAHNRYRVGTMLQMLIDYILMIRYFIFNLIALLIYQVKKNYLNSKILQKTKYFTFTVPLMLNLISFHYGGKAKYPILNADDKIPNVSTIKYRLVFLLTKEKTQLGMQENLQLNHNSILVTF